MIIRWEHEHDYVLVHMHQDMFGDWIVSKAWGQIGTRFGGLRHDVAENRDQADLWIENIAHIQTSRGYVKVLETSSDSSEGQKALDQMAALSPE